VTPTKGSLFNHADSPNVSYTLDTAIDCIRYTTTRQIEPDEELCIFYGLNLWFRPVLPALINASVAGSFVEEHEQDQSWGGLLTLSMEDESIEEDPKAIVPEDRLPFIRLKLTPVVLCSAIACK
jgi:tRNA-specific adenosine deaminase 3